MNDTNNQPEVVDAMRESREPRPSLAASMSGADLQRWYWLNDELVVFARELGVSPGGGKQQLTERIAARLDGRAVANGPVSAGAVPTRHQMQPPLDEDSVIPRGQRCSQVVRSWFSERVGSPFVFDAKMREFFAGADGTQTLGDALDHWRRTQDLGPTTIAPQFEFNRFTRAWHREHPEGARRDLLVAWAEYRATPADERGRI